MIYHLFMEEKFLKKNNNLKISCRQEVAEFLRFSYTELRAIVDMFYEEEEREIERIKRK